MDRNHTQKNSNVLQVHVLSMMQPDSLKRLLHGKMVGTQIVP